MRILLAEDELKIVEHIRVGLVAEGYAVDVAVDGDEALWLAEENAYDALLLDVSLPHKDGFTIVRHLRRKQILAPVIFLTARDEVEDKVRGLDAGADDYLTKPFSISELLARLRAAPERRDLGARGRFGTGPGVASGAAGGQKHRADAARICPAGISYSRLAQAGEQAGAGRARLGSTLRFRDERGERLCQPAPPEN